LLDVGDDLVQLGVVEGGEVQRYVEPRDEGAWHGVLLLFW
jgi:hypothetical protein